ncbi:MAG: SDR family oxidoreductase [Candidatus Aminicenantes bacterium]|nr:SDR family oxidoreductase [Candidatus Aminicenantes bacterium]
MMEGLRVLITGASSGIGREVALEFARKGAQLILAARRMDALRQVREQINTALPGAPDPLVVSCDVSDSKNVKKLVEISVRRFKGIDVLVNNAGIGVYGDTGLTALADFRAVMDVNFFGSVRCILEVLPYMKKAGRGLIVNVASVAAMYGVPFLGAYCASKAALVALSQSLRAELSGSGVSLMIVYPGYTQTEFFWKEKKVGRVRRPRGPYSSPVKVAKAIVKAVQCQKRNLVLSLEGKTLPLFQGILPLLIERVMERIAFQLRDGQEVSHV